MQIFNSPNACRPQEGNVQWRNVQKKNGIAMREILPKREGDILKRKDFEAGQA